MCFSHRWAQSKLCAVWPSLSRFTLTGSLCGSRRAQIEPHSRPPCPQPYLKTVFALLSVLWLQQWTNRLFLEYIGTPCLAFWGQRLCPCGGVLARRPISRFASEHSVLCDWELQPFLHPNASTQVWLSAKTGTRFASWFVGAVLALRIETLDVSWSV